jgi:SAM-dependent methyltransferase
VWRRRWRESGSDVRSVTDPFPWGAQLSARREVQGSYKTIWRLPVLTKLERVFARHLPSGARVLDVGAGARSLEKRLPSEVSYLSLDPDPSHPHDYRDLSEVAGPFEAILLFEVLEHLELEAILPLLERVSRLLGPSGVLFVSTPNTFHPSTYLRDASHRTPICYDELGGFLLRAGYELSALYRIHNDALLRKVARRYLLGWLFRLLGLDFAPQVVAVATARAQGASAG